jgi:sugar phosphate isomerase/epimerase
MHVEFTASTQTLLWKVGLETAIDEIATAGYGGVELMAAAPHFELWGDSRPAAAAAMEACRRAGVAITSVAAGFDVNLASPDGAMRDWSFRYYRAAGRLAAQLGAPYLVLHPGRRHPFKPSPYDAAREWVLEGLARITEAMQAEGVRPLIENTPTAMLDTAEECVDMVTAIGADRLGVCYDVANGFMVEEPGHGLRTVGKLVELIHLSDTTAASWQHDPIGAGDVDFPALAVVAKEVGFHGSIVAETIHPIRPGPGLQADRLALREAGWTAVGAAAER